MCAIECPALWPCLFLHSVGQLAPSVFLKIVRFRGLAWKMRVKHFSGIFFIGGNVCLILHHSKRQTMSTCATIHAAQSALSSGVVTRPLLCPDTLWVSKASVGCSVDPLWTSYHSPPFHPVLWVSVDNPHLDHLLHWVSIWYFLPFAFSSLVLYSEWPRSSYFYSDELATSLVVSYILLW